MPDGQIRTPIYNLESAIRSLGARENSYVIGIFDCCREPYNEKTKSMFEPTATRGGDGEKREDFEEGRNVFLIFGCPP